MFKTNEPSLRVILEQVHSGKMQLPDFQRNWVWDDDRIIGLLASISRGFPVGAIMTLDAGGDIKFKPRPVEGVSIGEDVSPDSFLLDGQQRLTSLYQALLYDGPVETRTSKNERGKLWYYIDILKALDPHTDREDAFISVDESKKSTYDFGRQITLDLSTPELEYENHMMPTELLLGDSMGWAIEYFSHWGNRTDHPNGNPQEFMRNFNESIIKPLNGYQLPVISLEKETPKEAVCKVFEKVNTGGITLNVFELMTASFAADNFQLREDWAARSGRMRSGYGVLQGIEGEHFLQAIALLTTYERRKTAEAAENSTPDTQLPAVSCKKDAILNLNLTDYRNWANAVEDGFNKAANFLLSQFVFRKNDLPYSTQLIPMAALFVVLGKELDPASASAKLERWYWSGIFGESYGGNTESQFALDLQQVVDYVRHGAEPTLITQANFIPERLLTLKTRNSAAYKGLYALQMKSGAADWRSGENLSIATWTSQKIDIHHIFPKRWCVRASIPSRLFDSIINKTPIDSVTNKIIGGNAPSRYLPRLERDIAPENPEELDGILKAHWIRPALLREDDFARAFVERGCEMMGLIGDAMGKPISDGREVFRDALDSAGVETQERFDDPEPEYDEVGEWAHDTAAD